MTLTKQEEYILNQTDKTIIEAKRLLLNQSCKTCIHLSQNNIQKYYYIEDQTPVCAWENIDTCQAPKKEIGYKYLCKYHTNKNHTNKYVLESGSFYVSQEDFCEKYYRE
jgi:hypothetical protein